MRLRTLNFLACAVALGLSAKAHGQVRTIEPCDDCPLELEHVARLGSMDDPVALSPYARVVQHADGSFLVAPTFEPGTFSVYSPQGNYLRSVGRSGQGPGELRGVRSVMTWRDSIFIAASGFMHVFGPDYRYARRFAIGALHRRGYAIANDGIYVNALGYESDGARNVVKLDHTGERTGDGWTSSPDRRPGGAYSDVAMLATNGPIVAFGAVPSYEIVRIAGGQTQRFEREADWFESWHDDEDGRTPAGDRFSRMMGLHLADDGLAVVIVIRQEARRIMGDPLVDYSRNNHAFWDSQIEVIDMQEGRVIGSVLRPEYFVGAAGNDLLYSIDAEPEGLVVADLWRIKYPPRE